MLDNVMMQLAAGSIKGGSTAIGTSLKGDRKVGASEESFSDILQAVVSGLNKGFESLKNGGVMNGDGTTITLDELLQTLFDGEGEETGTAESTLDMLQQMMSQLQAAVAHPVIVELQSQGIQHSEGDMFKLNVSLHNGNAAITYMAKAEDVKEKVTIHVHGDTPVHIKAMFKTGSADAEVVTESIPVAAEESSPSIGMIDTETEVPVSGETPDTPSLPQRARENAPIESKKVLQGNDTALANKNSVSVSSNGPAKNDASMNVQVISSNSGNIDIVPPPATVTTDAAGEVVKTSGAEPDSRGDGRTSSEGSETQLAAATSVHHSAYAKHSVPAKDVVHVSRLNEVSEPIMRTLQAGEKHLILKLSPPDLGDIQITLKMNNGILTADIKVDSNAVKDMFSLAVPQIKASIEESGIRAGEFFVDLREEHYSDGGRQQDEYRQQHQKKQKEQASQFFDYFV